MKLGLVTKLDKRKKTTSKKKKKIDDDFMPTNCEVIVIFPIWTNPDAGFQTHKP